MVKALKIPKINTTLEREWGRLRRSQIIGLVRASTASGHSPLSVELLRAVVEAGERRCSRCRRRVAESSKSAKPDEARGWATSVGSGPRGTSPP